MAEVAPTDFMKSSQSPISLQQPHERVETGYPYVRNDLLGLLRRYRGEILYDLIA